MKWPEAFASAAMWAAVAAIAYACCHCGGTVSTPEPDAASRAARYPALGDPQWAPSDLDGGEQ